MAADLSYSAKAMYRTMQHDFSVPALRSRHDWVWEVRRRRGGSLCLKGLDHFLCRENGDAKPKINTDAIETIGTWGHRVIRFPAAKASHPTHIPGTPEERKQTRANGGRVGKPTGDNGGRDSEDEAAAVNAAWKWRFNRRWRTEQVLPLLGKLFRLK